MQLQQYIDKRCLPYITKIKMSLSSTTKKCLFCHQSYICTNIKKNTSILYPLEEATTCITNHKIAQSLAKFDTLILLSWIQFKNKV